MTPLLELEDIHFAYDGNIPALSSLSLSVEAGERVAVLGANGCGKSTLLKVVAGLLFPQKGRYRAFGREITERVLSHDPFGIYFRKELGIVFQNADAQLFNPTVRDDIAFGPLQLNESPDAVDRKVEEAIAAFGLGALADRPPFALSGGEKRKVALASVMVMSPRVLLLDEPTTGLDPRSSRALVDLVVAAEEQGTTVLTATHDLHIVPEIATRVIVFGENRRVLASGPPEMILADRELLLAANLLHLHRHRHEDSWHAHPHDHPDVAHHHGHASETDSPQGG